MFTSLFEYTTSRTRWRQASLPAVLIVAATAIAGCSNSAAPGDSAALSSSAAIRPTSFAERAERRAYDGAPPVVAHEMLGVACTKCHTEQGMTVPTIGAAPANPHHGSTRDGSFDNCRQCHVFSQTNELFVATQFSGLPQTLSPTRRAHALAPPVIPHSKSMRSNCLACHRGASAREEIICSHPERANCVQCHLEGEKESDEPINLTAVP